MTDTQDRQEGELERSDGTVRVGFSSDVFSFESHSAGMGG